MDRMGSKACALLAVGGEGPKRAVIAAEVARARFVVAADSGFDLVLRLGIEPDLVVGDMDSLASGDRLRSLPAGRVRIFPPDKDETDTEIGLRLLGELGYQEVTMIGGGGGRLDHLVGILSLFERDFHPRAWYTAREHVEVIEGELVFGEWSGQTVSFFPLGQAAEGLYSEGLKWPLDGLSWRRGQAGISNLVTSRTGRVGVRRGRLLMIRSFLEDGRAHA